MIQRIQTIYLLLISLFSCLGWFLLPTLDISILEFPRSIPSKAYLISSGGIALLTLLLFKKRKLQLLLNRIHFFIQILILAVLVYELINSSNINSILTWLVLPLMVLILLIFSNRAIQKDEDLIRSVDRLR